MICLHKIYGLYGKKKRGLVDLNGDDVTNAGNTQKKTSTRVHIADKRAIEV